MNDEYKGVLWDIEESPYFKGVEMVETKTELKYWDVYPLTEEMRERLENDFTYRDPNQLQIERYQLIRDTAKEFAKLLVHTCPPSRELSLALTHLEESVMWANASIARSE